MKKYLKFTFILFAALVGVAICEWKGPASDLIFHWDMYAPRWLSNYVYYHHYLVMGAIVCFFSLVSASFLGYSIKTVIMISLLIGALRYFIEPLRLGGEYTLNQLIPLQSFALAFVIGLFTVIGGWYFVKENVLPKFRK